MVQASVSLLIIRPFQLTRELHKSAMLPLETSSEVKDSKSAVDCGDHDKYEHFRNLRAQWPRPFASSSLATSMWSEDSWDAELCHHFYRNMHWQEWLLTKYLVGK